MILKKVVGSMLLLGLMSPAFAHYYPVTRAEMNEIDSLKAQVAKMEAAMQQNQPGNFNVPEGWFKRITLSGQVNVDAAGSNRSAVTYRKGYADDIFVNNANLYIDADASDWTHAHLGLAYGTKSPDFVRVRPGDNHDNFVDDSLLDEAYVNIANFAKSPFFLKAGKQRVPFGDYVPYADITPSFTQLLSETHAVTADLGFADASGLYGSVFAFRGNNRQIGNAEATRGITRIKNWGGNLGFSQSTPDWGYKANVSYMYNMLDVDFISRTIYSAQGISNLESGLMQKHEGGIAAAITGRFDAFDGSLKYVTSLNRFNRADVATAQNNRHQVVSPVAGACLRGAEPQAWGADVGYNFPLWGHQNRVGVGYQGTKEADWTGAPDVNPFRFDARGLPRIRYLADYVVNISKYTDLGFEVREELNTKRGDCGIGATDVRESARRVNNTNHRGNNATIGTVRLSVKFA